MIYTFSSFLLPITVTTSNQNLNFDEGGGELLAQIDTGVYNLSTIGAALETALNLAGADVYTVTTDRQNRLITISSDGTFDLLISSGSQIGTTIFTDLGFTGADTGSAASHTSDTAFSFLYRPQFLIQNYVPADNKKEKIDSVINESSGGVIETINFGTRRKIKMDLKFITSRQDVADGVHIKYNPTGYEDAITFMDGIITKNQFEFMPDLNDADEFLLCILDKTPASSTGVGYEFTELSKQQINDVYELNGLVLRVID